MKKPCFEVITQSGHPMMVGGKQVTIQTQAVIVRFLWISWVWNRPISVLVDDSGQLQAVPIMDFTRIIQLTLLSLTGLIWLWFIRGDMRRKI